MEEEQRLYLYNKGSWEEVFTRVRKCSEYSYLVVLILFFFSSTAFAVENVTLVKESTFSVLHDVEDKNASQKILNSVSSLSFEQSETALGDRVYYAENSKQLAFAFSGSVPEKEADRSSEPKSLQLAEVQKLPSFSQESDLPSGEQKNEKEYSPTAVEQTQNKNNEFTVADDSSINKVQQLIDKAKAEKASAESFIVEEKQKKIQQDSPSLPEESKRAVDKISAIIEEQEVSQNTEDTMSKKEKKETASKPVRLFNTVDLFRKPIKGNAPKWERVVNLEKKKKPIFGSGAQERMPADVYKRWIVLREKIENLSDFEKAKAINRFFNQWPYKTDMELWGVEDYWEDPEEFLKKSGDCTDYAITKYYALRELGVPAEKMRVVALIDKIRGLGHAILAFYHNDTAYILDNTTPLFLEHTKYSHYDPKYSVNETYRWGHAKILRKVAK